MATSTLPLLFLLLISAIAATSARPCKTLFFITSSTSFYPIVDNSNPNPNPRYHTFFIASNVHPRPHPHFDRVFNNHVRLEAPRLRQPEIEEERDARSLSSSSSSMGLPIPSSMREKTKDIMGVVVALLLGMGCGVLTAATMYLIWSLFMPNRFEYDAEENDTFDMKKMGEYVAIPAKIVDDDLKKPANGNVPVAKEVV